MEVDFEPAAEREFWEAIERYEDKAPGIGWEFLQEVEDAAKLLKAHPEAVERVRYGRREVRRWVLRRFPYVIFYALRPEVLVVAVANASREPGYWLDRL